MAEEILINETLGESRAAVVDNGVLQELLIERTSRRSLVGNIYNGRVSRVLPGMQAAFVDIGLDRTAFLHASDIPAPDAEPGTVPQIRDLLKEGDTVLVQVLKEPMGKKGARLSGHITVPSRYLVLVPNKPGIGVSSRIDNEEERDRLKAALQAIVPEDHRHGYIIRTVAEGVGEEALQADYEFLEKLWARVSATVSRAAARQLVHEDLPFAVRVVRDLAGRDTIGIRVDSDDCHERLVEFCQAFMPERASIVERYTGRRPILDLYGIEDEIQKALQRNVSLKSGGYVVFDQTEAMTTADVNTGAFVGTHNQEETIFRTNLEAAIAIARQLRLRNLGGIIIIDFIDMQSEEHQRQVLEALEEALAPDHARTQITQVSPLGLVEMTRKRTRESLEHIMCDDCPACAGNGYIKTAETVCYEIFREILRQHRQYSFSELLVMAHEDVIEMLLDEESGGIAELESLTGKSIRLQSETFGSRSRFDVVPL